MVLVCMGEHDAEQIAAFFDEIADVGENEINTGEIVPGKRNAEIDCDPLPMPLPAQSIEREVHADFAYSAERREDEFVPFTRHQGPPAPDWLMASSSTSPASSASLRPPASINIRRPVSSIVSKRPMRSPSARRTRTVWPSPAARESQSVRMVAKCSLRFHCARRPIILADNVANNVAGATVAPAAARSVAGKSVAVG